MQLPQLHIIMKSLDQKFVGEGLTFDDVLVVPAYSEVLPNQVSVASRFSKKININVPLCSSAMDTVTEAALAIAIAQEGGIGVLHKNMTIDEQAKMVRQVKRAESGMIIDPVTLHINAIVSDALALMKEYKIGGIPVIDNENVLVGIVTNRDLRFEKNLKRHISEVMTHENLITTTDAPDLLKAEEILQEYKIEKLPVVDKNKKLIGLITYKDIIKMKERPNASKDEFGRLRVAAAVGIGKDTLARMEALVNVGVDAIVMDTAHGHSKGVIDAVKAARQKFPLLQIIAGNIATGEAAIALAEAGVDAVKVGIGPGSICTTRIVAGIGVPQLSAVMNVSQMLKENGYDIPIIADGGIRFSGDIVKVIAAGADSVMMGSMFAGTEESPGETIIFEGRKFKTYRGMGSIEAMQKGSKDRYFQAEETDDKKLVPEGIVGRVPYKGTLNEVLYQLIGGLRAGMGYSGAKNISELKNAKFMRITNAGVIESHPHNIVITREAPNYSRESLK
jgi:IMP dehydrogenase